MHLSRIFTWQICFNAICENKILAKISEFTISLTIINGWEMQMEQTPMIAVVALIPCCVIL